MTLMSNKFFYNSFIKILICAILSILIFFTFRSNLFYANSTSTVISFSIIQILIWSIAIKYKSFIKIISYNALIIIILNLISTPIFHQITFDVASRVPNLKIKQEYSGTFFKGIFSGIHVISPDEKGYRINKSKINYDNKEKDTLRIFAIGASTTEEMHLDDSKIWTNLLSEKIKKTTNKNVEIINTGIGGLRAEHHYILLKRLEKYQPDLFIFLTGINDWNHHIKNSEVEFIFPTYEIKYNFERSLLFKFFSNIKKQIKKKIFYSK